MQRLQYVDEMSYKLERGLKEVKFNEIYDEWTKILREIGVYHPIWHHEDMDFVKTMISGNNASRMLLEYIIYILKVKLYRNDFTKNYEND